MYSWSFKNLQVAPSRDGLENVVVSVDYRLGYTDDSSRWVYAHGQTNFAAPDPEDFIPFEDITEADMIAFVEETEGAPLDTVKTGLVAEYTANDPACLHDLPWVTAAAPVEG